MKKSKLKPTIEESFAVGRLEGRREMLLELMEMVKESGLTTTSHIRTYLIARLKTISSDISNNNTFKQKD